MPILRSRKILWLLLSLVALRGLVPVGYMLDATDGKLSIVVCGSGIYAAAAQSASAQQLVGVHQQHHHHHADAAVDRTGVSSTQPSAGSEHLNSDHSICPFAVAATGAGAPDPLPLAMDNQAVIGRVVAADASDFSSFGPTRAQQSRAPPALS